MVGGQKDKDRTCYIYSSSSLSLPAAEWRQVVPERYYVNPGARSDFCETENVLTVIVPVMAFDWVQDDVPMAGPSFMQRVQNSMRDDELPVTRGPNISTTITAPVALPDILPIEERPIIQQLMQHWLNERASPEVLPCRLDLLNDILEKLSDQVRVFKASVRRCC